MVWFDTTNVKTFTRSLKAMTYFLEGQSECVHVHVKMETQTERKERKNAGR